MRDCIPTAPCRYLGTLGRASSAGSAINSAGQVTGYSLTANNVQHAFVYANHTMQDLNSLIHPASPLAGT